ncbi:hypothetical protein AVEN_12173-1 [Araneus ventricosus]|uniref:Uncharacterized protein n=1 Tax=Araneus ventricosus TaxID=182803 RepID=A0A4Y2Q9A4_ARAVE|nr:hypothetical protein AVEN_12173-1 [Araneus ventricosus]
MYANMPNTTDLNVVSYHECYLFVDEPEKLDRPTPCRNILAGVLVALTAGVLVALTAGVLVAITAGVLVAITGNIPTPPDLNEAGIITGGGDPASNHYCTPRGSDSPLTYTSAFHIVY